MEVKATISCKNVNSEDKESHDMTVSIIGADTPEALQTIKDKIDIFLFNEYGALVTMSDNAKKLQEENKSATG